MKNDKDSYCRKILNAIPLIIFVVDEDVRILDLNNAASETFGLNKPKVLNRRGGETLHCLHWKDVPEGCGRGPFCRDCVIRNSVKECLKTGAITRRRSKITLLAKNEAKNLELLITASPMPDSDEPRVLLILEDVTEFSMLKDLLPICAKCKKIRDDKNYWHSIESYFNSHTGVEFSHGICPKCIKELYPDIAKRDAAS
jgi:hypothetical protein